MNTSQNKRIRRSLTFVLWGLFLLCNLALFASAALQAGLLVLALTLFLFVCEFGLLLRYARLVAQWRSIVLFWGVYALARMAAAALGAAGIDAAATFALLAAIYAMLAGWFALAALAIRRDVSVAYLVIALAVGPLVLRGQILAAGGVLAWLAGQRGGSELPSFTPLEPAMMAISCMLTLALLTFLPHFLLLLWREWRGAKAPTPAAPARSGDTQLAGPPLSSHP